MVFKKEGGAVGATDKAFGSLMKKEVELLQFLNEFGFCSIKHLMNRFAMKKATAYGYTKTLKRLGLLASMNVIQGASSVYYVTAKAVQLLQLDLPLVRRVPLNVYNHHLAVIDVHLKLRSMYPEATWISERRLIRDKGSNRFGKEDHLPDGALYFPDTSRCAIEVEKSQKSKERLEEILFSYGLQRTFKEVWYFCAKDVMPSRTKNSSQYVVHQIVPIGGIFMNTFENKINDYIDAHPKECLIFLLMTLSLVWQSGVAVMAVLIYVIAIRIAKIPRWMLMIVGAVIALLVMLMISRYQNLRDVLLNGFSYNKQFWLLMLDNKVESAFLFYCQNELFYTLAFSTMIAGIIGMIELIGGNPHGKVMQALKDGVHMDERQEVTEKAVTKALEVMQENSVDATVLGVSNYTGQPVAIPDRDINQVMLILGTTGAGKTVTLRRFYRRAITKGYPLIIIDGKPDEDNINWLKDFADKHQQPFYGFNCGNYRHYDSLVQGGFTELKDKVICLKDDWSSDYYRSIAEDYLQTTFQLLLRSGRKIDLFQVIDCLTYKNLVALANELQDEKLMTQVKRLKNYDVKDIAGLQAHLDILVNSELGEYFQNDESSFSLNEVINQGGVVYFALPALRFPSFSKVLGKLVINDIKAVVDRHKTKRPIFTIFDEFSVFAGEQVLNLVNMGRGKGVHAIFGTQGLGDLDRVDKSFKGQVLNCVNTLICHRLNDQDSAQAVSYWIGTKDAFTVTAQLNNIQGAAPVGSVRYNKEFIVHPDAIKHGLKTGEAFYVTKVGEFKWDKVRVKYE